MGNGADIEAVEVAKQSPLERPRWLSARLKVDGKSDFELAWTIYCELSSANHRRQI
jgi:hypothetical protein